MDQRSEYLIQILEKIGAPLMSAIIEQSAGVAAKNPDDDATQDAQKMAALLGKTVQAGIDLGNATDLAQDAARDDSLRLALTALAGPLVAEQFRRGGRPPGDGELKRIVTALQAVMAFSENFTSTAENTERLGSLGAEGKSADIHQIHVQYIQALTPVVNALGAFSFGQSEQKLIMDVTGRLTAKAAELKESLFGALGADEKTLCELALLRALAPLYAAAHAAETARLTKMSDQERAAQPQAVGGGLSLERVWSGFDTRVAMLEALAETMFPISGGTNKTPAPSEVIAPPPTISPVSTATPPVSGNPMSLFAKPKADTPQSPPPANTPPSAPPSGSSGNPMSFFKTPPKNSDES